jgi:hypothetical protein
MLKFEVLLLINKFFSENIRYWFKFLFQIENQVRKSDDWSQWTQWFTTDSISPEGLDNVMTDFKAVPGENSIKILLEPVCPYMGNFFYQIYLMALMFFCTPWVIISLS